MSRIPKLFVGFGFALTLSASTARADDITSNLKTGTPELKSAGALAFGPKGVLFVGDSTGGAIFAFDTGDTKPAGKEPLNVPNVDVAIATLLSATAKNITINDMKVNPASGNVWLSVSRQNTPVLVKIDRAGKLTDFRFADAKFASVKLPNATEKARTDAITGMAYIDDRLIVAGLSNEEFSSNLRSIPVPFGDVRKGTNVEIYHAAHGKLETNSPVRTFIPYNIAGETHILAAYTCTPLVSFPASKIEAGNKISGRTIAELGNRNRPLDMIVYTKGGKDYLLMANSARGVMKIPTEGFEKADSLSEPVGGGKAAGVPFESVAGLKGVMQLDKLDDTHAVVLVKGDTTKIETIELP